MQSLSTVNFLFTDTLIYKDFLEEKEEVLKHKWIESEKNGYDIGFERALIEWITRYRKGWRNTKQKYISSFNHLY